MPGPPPNPPLKPAPLCILLGLAPRCACNLWLLIGLKNADEVNGTCVRLPAVGGRRSDPATLMAEPFALPGPRREEEGNCAWRFELRVDVCREGGSPGSPTGPVSPRTVEAWVSMLGRTRCGEVVRSGALSANSEPMSARCEVEVAAWERASPPVGESAAGE